MNSRTMTKGEWAWLAAEVAILCFFVLLTVGLRAFMLLFNAHYLEGAALPWLTEKVLIGGPLHLPSVVATLIILAVTLCAIPFFIMGEARDRYLAHAPVLCLAVTASYLALILFTFLLPYIPIIGRLSGPDDPRPPGPIPEPTVSPWIWLGLAALYVVTMVGVILKRRRKAGPTKGSTRTGDPLRGSPAG